MKALITAFLLLIIILPAYTQDDYPMPDSATVVAFPWYDNKQFLYDYLEDRSFYDPPLKTDSLVTVFMNYKSLEFSRRNT